MALYERDHRHPGHQFNDVLTNRAGELGLPDWAQGRPEGFLFLDTYELPDEPDALAVIRLATTHPRPSRPTSIS